MNLRFTLIIAALLLSSVPLLSYAITVEISATVEGCGDNVIGVGEQCDGLDFGGASCASQGFNGGTLACSNVCTIDTSSCTSASVGNTGGGGGGNVEPPVIPLTNVVFTGKAFPGSTVTILKDAQIVATAVAGSDSIFQAVISNISGGDYIFSAYSEDAEGVRSPTLAFSVAITAGVTTKIGEIVLENPAITTSIADVNGDEKINLVDFSILVYWYKRPSPPASIDLNQDGKVDLVDFSIMAFNWTG